MGETVLSSDATMPLGDIYNCATQSEGTGRIADSIPASKSHQRAVERKEAKAKVNAERMAPRSCKLPSCRKIFTPKRIQDWKSEFCASEHQKRFWVEANQLGAAAIVGGVIAAPAEAVKSEFKPGVSHCQQVLALLQKHANEWIEHPRQLLPGVIWNSRVADLRARGYNIEMRRVGKPTFLNGGGVEYQYRLVEEV